MIEFELNSQSYRIGKLDAMRQFHLSRRIAPIIPTLIPVFVKLSNEGSLKSNLIGFADVLGPFAQGIADMSDEAGEYIIGACLSVTQRSNGQGWANVWSAQAKACMFDDMDLGTIMQIVMRVIQDSLGPFISGILTSQQGSPAALTQTG